MEAAPELSSSSSSSSCSFLLSTQKNYWHSQRRIGCCQAQQRQRMTGPKNLVRPPTSGVYCWRMSTVLFSMVFLVLGLCQPCQSRRLSNHYYNFILNASSPSSMQRAQQQQQQQLPPWKQHNPNYIPNNNNNNRKAASTRESVRAYQQQQVESHFLDYDQVQADDKARRYNLNINQPRRRNAMGSFTSSWTTRLIWANIAIYLLQLAKPSVTEWGVKLSYKILRGEQLYRLLTPVFLHGTPIHLMTNLYSLQNLGPAVERVFGPGRFLATYLISGMAGNVLSAIRSPNPALGASGAVFGLIGAYVVFLNRHDWLLGRTADEMSGSLYQTMMINIFMGITNPRIDNWGHVGGAIGGAVMAYYFGPRLFVTEVPAVLDSEFGMTRLHVSKILIDKPVIRLPRKIESIPEQVSKTMQRITRRFHVERHKADLPSQPWRKNKNDFPSRPPTPNKSIKPGKVD